METKSIKNETMTLLPPKKDVCQECAISHKPDMPHDATTLYYQVKFMMQYNRGASWEDAMKHCSEDIKSKWRVELKKFGIDTDSLSVRPK